MEKVNNINERYVAAVTAIAKIAQMRKGASYKQIRNICLRFHVTQTMGSFLLRAGHLTKKEAKKPYAYIWTSHEDYKSIAVEVHEMQKQALAEHMKMKREQRKAEDLNGNVVPQGIQLKATFPQSKCRMSDISNAELIAEAKRRGWKVMVPTSEWREA